ncbi:MAG TPA: amidohydrolase family protein [Acidimicrobiales bacterium]|jgi:predicted TIM-barrel fold metal-dependent hydrolase|nr:amidohydrolase family protein [Acidimicrobiales bacterium]
MALPKIISVDDHVVEPPHVWQTWLPEKYRERGPKVVDRKWGGFKHLSGAKYDMVEDPEGEWGSAWYYDGDLIYVHKKFVAIPQASCTLDEQGHIVFDRTQMTMTAITYDAMRKGCWDRDERVKDMTLNYVDGSLPFPTFPRFCGQTFYEAKDKELALACVRANNDWMVEEWCEPSGGVNIPLCLIPLWDAELAAAETKRNAERGVRAITFSEMPTRLGLPSINTDYWDPLWEVCNDYGVTVCMHVGSSSSNPVASPDSHPAVGVTLGFNNAIASMADWLFSGQLLKFPKLKLAYSEGQIGWIPYVLERADTVWEMHDAWVHSKARIPVPPSTQYYGRIFGCFTADHHGLNSLSEVGEDNICFETDFPHTDGTWPDSEAYIEKLCVGLTDEQAYKILRGNAIKMLELDRT